MTLILILAAVVVLLIAYLNVSSDHLADALLLAAFAVQAFGWAIFWR